MFWLCVNRQLHREERSLVEGTLRTELTPPGMFIGATVFPWLSEFSFTQEEAMNC